MTPRPVPCRRCRRPVLWVRLPSGPLPLDPEPTPGGTVVLADQGGGRVLTAREQSQTPAGLLYRAHFASCPQSPFRRKGAPTPRPACRRPR